MAIKCHQCTKDATLYTCESADDNGKIIDCPANVKFCETISYSKYTLLHVLKLQYKNCFLTAFEGKEYTHRDCAPSSIYYLDGKEEDTCIGTSSYQRKDGSVSPFLNQFI